ncbi:hypothetical protein LL946_15310 [Knoellia locipacati]|uniref:hypothetical protein n=1 Tax=Knoellia locipacati TaxID=882824 RepID=UPI00384C313F
MTPEDILERVGEQVGVRRVFGTPVEHSGVLLVPVAVAIGGGGGSQGSEELGSGAGFGGMVRGIGVYEVKDGRVRFVPAVDTTALAAMGVVLAGLVLRATARRR